MFLIQMVTGVVYFMSVVLLRQYIDIGYINLTFIMKVGAITLITWAPLHLFYSLAELIDPSEHKKVEGV